MKKKLIYVMSASLLLGGLTFGFNNSEVRAQEELKPSYPCKNGGTFGIKNLGVCYGESNECYRCRIFAQ
ncbi:hypothetical protein [Marivirga sp.]|uniref:hypothetical protein n=1 Tax=Marivirga sp. TaxID=2018662 RepID=UPI002D7FAE5F|nr:hypothetical protein [Marivirga sp.]HET8860063.1 hypothetical protein [Marivirga sp.]